MPAAAFFSASATGSHERDGGCPPASIPISTWNSRLARWNQLSGGAAPWRRLGRRSRIGLRSWRLGQPLPLQDDAELFRSRLRQAFRIAARGVLRGLGRCRPEPWLRDCKQRCGHHRRHGPAHRPNSRHARMSPVCVLQIWHEFFWSLALAAEGSMAPLTTGPNLNGTALCPQTTAQCGILASSSCAAIWRFASTTFACPGWDA